MIRVKFFLRESLINQHKFAKSATVIQSLFILRLVRFSNMKKRLERKGTRLRNHSPAFRIAMLVVFFIGFILTVVLFLLGSGEAETLYVDDGAEEGGNGSMETPYNLIQDAIDKALHPILLLSWMENITRTSLWINL